MDSYATNIKLSLTNEIIFDKGPLFNLINGSIKFSGTTPQIKLDMKQIALQFSAQNTYQISLGDSIHSITIEKIILKMNTVPISINEFYNQLTNSGFGFSYDSTVYESNFFGIKEKFNNSLFNLLHINKAYYWEGEYSASLVKNYAGFYLKGFASNRSQNYTDYFCDIDLKNTFGRANHDTSLTFGYFHMLNGDSIKYSLE